MRTYNWPIKWSVSGPNHLHSQVSLNPDDAVHSAFAYLDDKLRKHGHETTDLIRQDKKESWYQEKWLASDGEHYYVEFTDKRGTFSSEIANARERWVEAT